MGPLSNEFWPPRKFTRLARGKEVATMSGQFNRTQGRERIQDSLLKVSRVVLANDPRFEECLVEGHLTFVFEFESGFLMLVRPDPKSLETAKGHPLQEKEAT